MKPFTPPELLITRRLALRRLDLSHAHSLYLVINQDRDRLDKYLPWVEHIKSVEDERFAIRNSCNTWDDRSAFDWIITETGASAPVGCIGAHTIRWNHASMQVGFWIDSAHEGRGLITEALTTIENTFFESGIHRIELRCDAHNDRSRSVAERCQYKLEGRLQDEMFRRGRYVDTLIFAKLKI